MDETDNLIGVLLSEVAGILENASVIAASAETASDPAAVTQLERDIADAAVLAAAARVVQRRK